MNRKLQPWERRAPEHVLADVTKVSESAADLARAAVVGRAGGANAVEEVHALRAQLNALVPEVDELVDGATKRDARFLLSEGALDLQYVEDPSPMTSLRLARLIANTRSS